jgi:hypothetical protein
MLDIIFFINILNPHFAIQGRLCILAGGILSYLVVRSFNPYYLFLEYDNVPIVTFGHHLSASSLPRF